MRAERRAHDVCPYEIVPSSQNARAIGEDKVEKPKLPGYLGTYGVDCKEVTFLQTHTSLWLLNLHCWFALPTLLTTSSKFLSERKFSLILNSFCAEIFHFHKRFHLRIIVMPLNKILYSRCRYVAPRYLGGNTTA